MTMHPTTPKPNAPNSPAWTRPLTAPRTPAPKPRPGSRAARIALWTMPLDAVIANVKGGAR